LARQLAQPYPSAVVPLAKGIADALEGRWESTRNLCDQAEGIFRTHCTGVMWELSTAQRFALWPLMFLGEVAEMGRRLPALIKEARERNDLYAVTNLSLVIRTFVRLVDDEPERARRELRQVMDEWSQQVSPLARACMASARDCGSIGRTCGPLWKWRESSRRTMPPSRRCLRR
jgi:hypothetical protein